MPDSHIVTDAVKNKNIFSVKVSENELFQPQLFGAKAHHEIENVICVCGKPVVGFVQPALVVTLADTLQVHCVNPECQYYMRTLDIQAWRKLTGAA